MKAPEAPKPFLELLAGLTPERLFSITTAEMGPLPKGEYLHWDEIRRREPPKGLDSEAWWCGIRFARQPGFRKLPLLDKGARPFVFGLPEPALVHLHHIDQEAGATLRSLSEPSIPAHRDEYLMRSLIEESITSSQLEGASTTRKVAEAMLREHRPPRTQGERMIFNNFRTMQAIQGLRDEPMTPPRIMEIHRLVTEGTLTDPADAGRYRQSNDIRVYDRDNNETLHVPPNCAELPERMARLCAFANGSEADRPFIHPVLRAILLHFMIGYDHPFVDGNGRTARALFYWSMLRSGYWLAEFISISHILRKAPAQYGRAYLYTETDEGDTTYFLLHQLDTIRKALEALHAFLDRRRREQASLERLLSPSAHLGSELNHRQRDLLIHALKHPGASYTIAGHRQLHRVVYQTARMDLLNLVAWGLLEEGQVGRAKVFSAPWDLRNRLAARH